MHKTHQNRQGEGRVLEAYIVAWVLCSIAEKWINFSYFSSCPFDAIHVAKNDMIMNHVYF